MLKKQEFLIPSGILLRAFSGCSDREVYNRVL